MSIIIKDVDKLSIFELDRVISDLLKLKSEKESSIKYLKKVRFDDGCEGFYCDLDEFGKIKSFDLHEFIASTLSHDSDVHISIVNVHPEDWDDLKQYDWFTDYDKPISYDLGDYVYHKDIYNGKEKMKIVGIREDSVELEGDYSGGTHAIVQKDWLNIDGLIFIEDEN